MKIVKGGITYPQGFLANGICCGIKKIKRDLTLIASSVPCKAAAVFTKNSIKAAPLGVSQKHLTDKKAQAIIINSGNANCFSGKFGTLYAQQTTECIGDLLKIKAKDVVVTSTGIIGKALPIEKILKGAPELVDGLKANRAADKRAAEGILTTDLVTKEYALELGIGGKKVKIGGVAKGSGMIAPNMATMLGFVTTDCAISASLLQSALNEANAESFNSISVDGCMSTNDMVVVLANGLAKNPTITSTGKEYEKFTAALKVLCVDLAKKIVLDGEGATKFIEITVNGAKTPSQARMLAMSIANSNLVKTAAYGENPNWGRVAAAIGSHGIKQINEETCKIKFSSFKKKNITINVEIQLGKASATVFTSDLSKEYVDINADYN